MKKGEKDKRGVGKIQLVLILSIIVIVVGGGILVYNLAGFDGESDLEGKSLSDVAYGSTGESEPVSRQCAFACETEQKASFCDVQRTLPDGTSKTCEALASQNLYNVESCSSISCNEVLDQTCVSGLGGEWTTPEADGSCPAQEDKFVRKRTPSDSPPTAGQICCYYYE